MKKHMKQWAWYLVMLLLACSMTACGDKGTGDQIQDQNQEQDQGEIQDGSYEEPEIPVQPETPIQPRGMSMLPTVDPSGAEISVPEEVNSIVVLAPSIAETVVALGDGDLIVAYDTQSVGLTGLPSDVPVLDMVNPDMEQLMALHPDVLLVTSLSLYDQEAPYQQLIDAGVCVICIPTSDSMEGIKSDIAFLAAVLGKTEEGDRLIGEMQAEIDAIAAIAETIPEERTVYFEIAAAPDLYSFGNGVYLNEMIELIGAKNILAEEDGWLSVGEETVVAADPDVILTNVNYIEDAVGEIKGRNGWDGLKAVQNDNVHYVDNMASSLPNQNVVKALRQMAEAVYPEYYGE
ncbi:MAG: ABC transporter substrate-binding protein [Lachnospiraceae bacterium]|nr:ABC transporter substrate-binding protein [Lachnospiraceae bacterium]